MKCSFILFTISSIVNTCVFSQNIDFKEVSHKSPNLIGYFHSVVDGKITSGDVDGDGDIDLIVTRGYDSDINNNEGSTKLYLNDGLGNFLMDNKNYFYQVKQGEAVLFDMDGDSDLDLFLIGGSQRLYSNNGLGKFTEITIPAFSEGLFEKAWAVDIDNDNDLDLVVLSVHKSVLYKNDGSGVFTKFGVEGHEDFTRAEVNFADVDGDSDVDMLVNGTWNQPPWRKSELYLNDGNGNFTVSSNYLEGIIGASDFGDIDGDGDNDIILVGQGGSILYLNDGAGNFSQSKVNNLVQIQFSNVKLVDIDNDNDLDIILTGDWGEHYAKTYKNNGSGTFTDFAQFELDKVQDGDIEAVDLDGDSDLDLILSGYNDTVNLVRYYLNNGSGRFERVQNTQFYTATGVVINSDIDGDNDADILIFGEVNNERKTSIYRNLGNAQFLEVNNSLRGYDNSGSADFADIDNDGDNDLLITGNTVDGYKTDLYINDGLGEFELVPGTNFAFNRIGEVKFAELNGDGYIDVIINGASATTTSLYLNNRDRTFTEITNAKIIGSSNGSVEAFDADGDLDIDILVTGYVNGNMTFNLETELYLNNGNAAFTQTDDIDLISMENADISIADIDGDLDLDVVMTGQRIGLKPYTYVYQNDGGGDFSLLSELKGFKSGNSAFSDIDLDGDFDLIITGNKSTDVSSLQSVELETVLYVNDGDGNFELYNDNILCSVYEGGIAVTDFDNDGKDDLLFSGWNNEYKQPFTRLYLNKTEPTIISANSGKLDSIGYDVIYPNPVKKYLFSDCLSGYYQILNSIGYEIQSGDFEESFIGVESLDSGVYFLVINGIQVFKFVK